MEELKTCKACGETKPLDDFYFQNKAKGVKQPYCKECDNAKRRKNHADNREERNQKSKDWYEANKEAITAINKEWAAANIEKVRTYKRKWKANNPETVLAHKRKRRALEMGCEGSHTAEEITDLYEQQNGLCVYCGADLSEGKHADHIMPLSLGGSNYISNIQLLCPTCNNKKWNKHPDIYEAEIGFIRNKESVNGANGNQGVYSINSI